MANSSVDCAALSSRQSFPQYIHAINKTVDGNFTLASRCQAEVCELLFGFGTEDVNGIGLMIGYMMANVLGVVLPMGLLLLEREKHKSIYSPVNNPQEVGSGFKTTKPLDLRSRLKVAVEESLWRFFESTALLSFSLQIAAIVILVELDFGISANGMGGTTGKIARAVSIVNVIPFTYTISAYDLIYFIRNDARRTNMPSTLERRPYVKSSNRNDSPMSAKMEPPETVKQSRDQSPKRFISLLIFAICWGMALYPMLGTFFVYYGPSQISTSKSAVIHPDDFATLTAACYINVQALTDTETRIMGGLSISAVLILILFMLIQVSMYGAERRSPMSRFTRHLENRQFLKRYVGLTFAIMISVAIGQFWTIFRLEKLQDKMARSAGQQYPNDSWDFGQIVAVTVMTPVFVQGLYSLFSARPSPEECSGKILSNVNDFRTPSSLGSTTGNSSPASYDYGRREPAQTKPPAPTIKVTPPSGYIGVPRFEDPFSDTNELNQALNMNGHRTPRGPSEIGETSRFYDSRL